MKLNILSLKKQEYKLIRACYQHCILQWVLRKQMTNQSLRERFGVSEGSSNTISQIITAAVDQGLVKNDPVNFYGVPNILDHPVLAMCNILLSAMLSLSIKYKT